MQSCFRVALVLGLLALPLSAGLGQTGSANVKPDKHAIGPHSADPTEAKFQRDPFYSPNDDAAAGERRDQQWSNTIAPNTLVDPGSGGGIGAESINVTHIDYVGEGRPALPIDQSELIAIGNVLSSKAFVTPDKTGVYTEFVIAVGTVSKGGLPPGGTTVLGIRGGGSVVFPSGHKRKVVFEGIGYPNVGKTYLFFLHQMPQTASDFGILTAYELSGTTVYVLDNEGAFKQYEGMNQSTFLSTVRVKISAEGL